MNIIHLSRTSYTNCGIGNFAINFHLELKRLFKGTSVNKIFFCDSTRNPGDFPNHDILIYHHEFSFEKNGLIEAVESSNAKIKIAFIHSDCRFINGYVKNNPDAYICMNERMIETDRPVFMHPCPGYYEEMGIRGKLRKKEGIDSNTFLVGTFSMLHKSRRVLEIANEILKRSKSEGFNNVKVLIASSSHEHDKQNKDAYKDKLEAFAKRNKDIIFFNEFMTQSRRSKLMQMCDALWCFSSVTGMQYASASCSDMYCSGTRLILNKCPQHFAVIDQPNVEVSEDGEAGIIERILKLIKRHKDYMCSCRIHPMYHLRFGTSFEGLDSFIWRMINGRNKNV